MCRISEKKVDPCPLEPLPGLSWDQKMQTAFLEMEGAVGLKQGKETAPVGPAAVAVALVCMVTWGAGFCPGACAPLPEDHPALEKQGTPKCPGSGTWLLVCPPTSIFGNNLS